MFVLITKLEDLLISCQDKYHRIEYTLQLIQVQVYLHIPFTLPQPMQLNIYL